MPVSRNNSLSQPAAAEVQTQHGTSEDPVRLLSGTADHLFGTQKLVQVLKARDAKGAQATSWSDVLKNAEYRNQKAMCALDLFNKIESHRRTDPNPGAITEKGALALFAEVLRNAKPKALPLIDASVDIRQGTFSLIVDGNNFKYTLPVTDVEGMAFHYREKLEALIQAHKALKGGHPGANSSADELAARRYVGYMNKLVGQQLAKWDSYVPGARDEDGDEIPPPPLPKPNNAGHSGSAPAKNPLLPDFTTLKQPLETIAEETDDELFDSQWDELPRARSYSTASTESDLSETLSATPSRFDGGSSSDD